MEDTKYVPSDIADKYQPLFNFMFKKYGIGLTILEMDEILKISKIVNESLSPNNHDLLVEALNGSLQMMEQSLIYRKANGLTNNTMLEATILKAREALSKAE